jgi:hypothetical protein
MICVENNALVYHPTQKSDGTELKEIDAIWWGDLYQCPVCKKKIATGFGRMRLGLEVLEEFKKKVIETGIKFLR